MCSQFDVLNATGNLLRHDALRSGYQQVLCSQSRCIAHLPETFAG
jgi:hypothetical protein